MRKLRGWMLQLAVHMKARDLMRNRGKWPDLSRKQIKKTMLKHCAEQFDRSWPGEDA